MSRRRGATAQTSASGKTQINMLKTRMHGHQNNLSGPVPPPFNRNPFNTIVVEELLGSMSSGGVTLTLKSLDIALRAQLNLSPETTGTPTVIGKNQLMFKVQRIDVWGKPPSDGTITSVRCGFFSLFTPIQTGSPAGGTGRVMKLKLLEDFGLQGAEWAKVSFSYPSAEADRPLSAGDATGTSIDMPVVSIVPGSLESTVIIRYHLHWSTGVTTDAPPVDPRTLGS